MHFQNMHFETDSLVNIVLGSDVKVFILSYLGPDDIYIISRAQKAWEDYTPKDMVMQGDFGPIKLIFGAKLSALDYTKSYPSNRVKYLAWNISKPFNIVPKKKLRNKYLFKQ